MIIQTLDEKKYNKNLKMVFLSGHDTTLSFFLWNFIFFNYEKILEHIINYDEERDYTIFENGIITNTGYSSNLLLELHNKDDQQFIKILINGRSLILFDGKDQLDL